MTEQLTYRATLCGHKGWVTQVTTTPSEPNMLVSTSRDKKLVLWYLKGQDNEFAVAQKALVGHNHFVSDVVLSSDGLYAVSGSWDKTLRLWDLQAGKTTRRFEGHEQNVLSVAFSNDNRQIMSGSRDKTARLWNTLGVCKYTFNDNGHTGWVSHVRFSSSTTNPIVVTCGWDKLVKVWSLTNCNLLVTHHGHTGPVNCVTVSPDSTLCASGGKDGQAMLWDLKANSFLYTLQSFGVINALCFSPNRYWLCAAIGSTIKIWDLEQKVLVEQLTPELFNCKQNGKSGSSPICTCLTWSADGQTLFAGFTDGCIRVWQLTSCY